jgi:5-methylthioadenosine/S-adenosylhomocysteine deaminase
LRVARAGVLVHADGSVIEDAALAWKGDSIVACGPWRAMRRAAGDAPVVGGRDAVLVPGLVNAHQHGHGLTSLAGGVSDQPLEGWLAEGLGIPVPSDRASILLAAARQIRSGVTTAVHLHACRRPADPGRMHARIAAYRESGLSVAFASGFKSRRRFALADDEAFLAGLDDDLRREIVAAFGEPPALDYLPGDEWAAAMREAASAAQAEGDGVRLLVGPAGPEWCEPGDLALAADVARELGLGIQVHLAESPLQAMHAARHPGVSGLAALERAGLVGSMTSLVHVVHATEQERERIATSGAMVVTCPGSNLRLAHGVAPIADLAARGVAVALGSDSIGFGDRDDLWSEARLLMALHERVGVRGTWAALTTAGARAATMPRAGRLEPGARADFVLLDAAGITEPAGDWLGDPAAVVLGRARPQDVRLVVARGREILRDGRILAFDEQAVAEEARDAIARSRRDPASALRARRVATAVREAHLRLFGRPA